MTEEIRFILGYEIRSSKVASLVSFKWGQKLLGSYFAWKVRKKYDRYLLSKQHEKQIKL